MEIASSSNINKNYMDGLLCHYLFSNGSAQYVFLDVNYQNQISVDVNPSLSFCSDANLHICALCNDLVLFSSISKDNHLLLSYSLFNLSTKLSVVLPQPVITRRSIQTGLAFDRDHYHVVRIFRIKEEESTPAATNQIEVCMDNNFATDHGGDLLAMEIFSSETYMWRQYVPLLRLPPDQPKHCATPLYLSGSIYWELGGFLLSYDINIGHCKLIKLPTQDWSANNMTFGQCLWQSNGRLHYCYSDRIGIHTWVLINEHSRNDFNWKLTDRISFQFLMSINPQIFYPNPSQRMEFSVLKPYFVAPCGYHEESETLYIRLPGMYVSYSKRTQRLQQICSFTFPNTSFYCCMVFPVVSVSNKIRNSKPPAFSGFVSSDKGIVNLPIRDQSGSSSSYGCVPGIGSLSM